MTRLLCKLLVFSAEALWRLHNSSTTIKLDIVHTTSHSRYSYWDQQTADNVKKLNGHEKLSSCATQKPAIVRKIGNNRSTFIIHLLFRSYYLRLHEMENFKPTSPTKRQSPLVQTNKTVDSEGFLEYPLCLLHIHHSEWTDIPRGYTASIIWWNSWGAFVELAVENNQSKSGSWEQWIEEGVLFH